MVSTEISLSFANDENTLQTYLEDVNPSYRQAREIYNILLKKTTNPLLKNGLATNKESFLIILLEKILRNTEILVEQNTKITDKLQIIQEDIIDLKQQGLDPIIQAGNKITTELKTFEIGFQNWNTKFDKFQEIFNSWNTGFNTFDENLTKLDTFLKHFSKYWETKTNIIQGNLAKIEHHITQWNDEIIGINTSINSLEKRFIEFLQRQDHLVVPRNLIQTTGHTSSTKSKYQELPSNHHQWKL